MKTFSIVPQHRDRTLASPVVSDQETSSSDPMNLLSSQPNPSTHTAAFYASAPEPTLAFPSTSTVPAELVASAARAAPDDATCVASSSDTAITDMAECDAKPQAEENALDVQPSTEHDVNQRPRKRPRTTSVPGHQGAKIASASVPASAASSSSSSPTATQTKFMHQSESSTVQQPTGVRGLRLKSRPSRSVPLPVQPLIQVGTRIYFAVFDPPLPAPSALIAHDGTCCAVFHERPPKSAGINAKDSQLLNFTPANLGSMNGRASGPVPQARDQANAAQATTSEDGPKGWAPRTIQSKFHWFTVDRKSNRRPQVDGDTVPNDFQHLSFYDDWGPFNMSLVFQFCCILGDYLMVRMLSFFLRLSEVEKMK